MNEDSCAGRFVDRSTPVPVERKDEPGPAVFMCGIVS
jgi:hypothetical protein